jgi:hypothetical protein
MTWRVTVPFITNAAGDKEAAVNLQNYSVSGPLISAAFQFSTTVNQRAWITGETILSKWNRHLSTQRHNHGTLNFRAGVLTLPDAMVPLLPISSSDAMIPLLPISSQRSETVPVSLVEDLHIPPSCEKISTSLLPVSWKLWGTFHQMSVGTICWNSS